MTLFFSKQRSHWRVINFFVFCIILVAFAATALLWGRQKATTDDVQRLYRQLDEMKHDFSTVTDNVGKVTRDSEATNSRLTEISNEIKAIEETTKGSEQVRPHELEIEKAAQDKIKNLDANTSRTKTTVLNLPFAKQKQEELQLNIEKKVNRLDMISQYFLEKERLRRNLIDADANKPQPFSQYSSHSWQEKLSGYEKKLKSLDGENGWQFLANRRASYITNYSDTSLLIDGIVYPKVSIYNFVNDQSNIGYVLAPAFAFLDRTLSIFGDPGKDEVRLDGCLKWKKTGSQFDHDIWEARDSENVAKNLNIQKGLKVEIESFCDNRYFMRRVMLAVPVSLKYVSKFTGDNEIHFGPLMEVSNASTDYIYDAKKDIAAYEAALKELKDWDENSPITPNVENILSLMKKNLLPTRFSDLYDEPSDPNHYYLANISFFLPNSEQSQTVKEKCFSAIQVNIKNGATVKCQERSTIFFNSEKGNSRLESRFGGFFFGAPGVHVLKTGVRHDVIILKKGWGKQIIDKNCLRANIENAVFGNVSEEEFFGGDVGLSTDFDENFGFMIDDIAKDGPASKTSITKGSIITALDGVPTRNLTYDEFLKKIRGEPGKAIKIKIFDPIANNLHEETIERANMHLGKKSIFQAYNWKPSHKFNNFIVLEGVAEQDVKWNKTKTLLTNLRTHDTISFVHPACHNIVFAPEAVTAPAPDQTQP